LAALVEHHPGVQARATALREAFAAWWNEHATRIAALPERRDLNRLRGEILESFGATLGPLGMLGHFKLAGVVADWWAESLPDLKTLLENGFRGVIEGWLDAIADALEDDEAAGPAFDPFAHKLVCAVMPEYLEQVAAAKTDIVRLKGEKEAFEASNPPEDVDDEELANWDYAATQERQIRELRGAHRDALRDLARLERAGTRARATGADREAAAMTKVTLAPALDQIAALEATLAPYEKIKQQLAEARARYRELIRAFLGELESRCDRKSPDEVRGLTLDLMAQHAQAGLGAALLARRQESSAPRFPWTPRWGQV
jgi:type I restriction enzyme M protein